MSRARKRAARNPAARNRAAASRVMGGFTLIEVMLALSILAVTLIGLISRTSANIRLTQEAGMLDVATELARSKMYDIEAELLHEGFSETNQDDRGDFSDEGWPNIQWEAVVEKVELPGLSAMQEMQEGEGEGGEEGGALGGGILGGGMLGMGGGDDMMAGAGGMIASQFEMITQVLEVSIRKVTVTVKWTVGQEKKEMVVACYFTDSVALDQVLGGAGAPTTSGPGSTPGGPGGSRGSGSSGTVPPRGGGSGGAGGGGGGPWRGGGGGGGRGGTR